eukprot:4591587-Pyramimonas_sp.AAC.2
MGVDGAYWGSGCDSVRLNVAGVVGRIMQDTVGLSMFESEAVGQRQVVRYNNRAPSGYLDQTRVAT